MRLTQTIYNVTILSEPHTYLSARRKILQCAPNQVGGLSTSDFKIRLQNHALLISGGVDFLTNEKNLYS